MFVATVWIEAYRSAPVGLKDRAPRSAAEPHRAEGAMAKQKVPGSREEESWFSEEQLENLELADEVEDDLKSPIPTQMVSNGE